VLPNVASILIVFGFHSICCDDCGVLVSTALSEGLSDGLEDHAFLVFRFCHSEEGDGMFSEAS